VKETLSKPGKGKVLVVDAGGSLKCALVGDLVAGIAAKHKWTGIVLNGCVRDVTATNKVPIGIRALGHVPLASEKHGLGAVGVPVAFAGVNFVPGHHLYCDIDGIVVSETPLK
jgi:regulator of ribonuclease activity A